MIRPVKGSQIMLRAIVCLFARLKTLGLEAFAAVGLGRGKIRLLTSWCSCPTNFRL